MQIRFTIVDPARVGAHVDVLVDAPSSTRLGEIDTSLRAAVGERATPATSTIVVAGAPVRSDAVLGLPPLVEGAVLVLTSGSVARNDDTQRPGADLTTVDVVAGEGAGSRTAVGPGTSTIGRGVHAQVRLDGSEISSRHAELHLGPSGANVRDLGSTNGTALLVAGVAREVGEAPTPVPAQGRLRIGGRLLAVRTATTTSPAAVQPDGEGHLLVNRTPCLRPAATITTVRFAVAPSDPPDRTRVAWLPMLLPLAVALPLAWWWRQPLVLLFALLSPLMMLGQYLSDRRGSRRRSRTAARQADDARAEARRQVDAETAAADHRVEQRCPDLAELAAVAALPGRRLWERDAADPDAARVRLGRGTCAVEVLVTDPPPEVPVEPDDEGRLRAVRREATATLDLLTAPVVGIAGDRTRTVALTRSLVGQLAVLLSPRRLRIAAICGHDSSQTDWQWLRWLPHYDDVTPPVSAGEHEAPLLLVVVDGVHALADRPEIAALLAAAGARRPGRPGRPDGLDGTSGRTIVICLDTAVTRLPASCSAIVSTPDVPDACGTVAVTTADGTTREVQPDLPSLRWAVRLARALAPLRESGSAGGLEAHLTTSPREVSLLDVLHRADGVDAALAGDLARRWAEPITATAVIGLAPGSSALRLDLRRDGPHALIAGTTGAGKSELLRTIVASLAVTDAPSHLAFLLVDYKGGAAFADLVDLPHVAGLLTDLDPATSHRALASLDAELRRRERLLSDAGVSDIDAYTRSAGALPRLVIVVDEFRVLSQEVPEFVEGLVRVAAVGRSLGVHLILATQRPAGAVTPDMRANLTMRIALRVRDAADSHDVVGEAVAASLPVDRPGRAVARVGNAPLVPFQVAHLGQAHAVGPTRVHTLDAGLRVIEAPAGSAGSAMASDANPAPDVDTILHAPAAGDAPSDAARVVRAAREAAFRCGLSPATPPWCPPLPDHLTLDDPLLQTRSDDARGGDVMLGLADLPHEQLRQAAYWHYAGFRHLAVVGGPRCGRSSFVRLVAVASGAQSPEMPHVYVIDGSVRDRAGSALRHLEHLPQVGAVVAGSDIERCRRLLRHLAALPSFPGEQTGARLRPDVTRARSRPDVANTPHLPVTMLLIDDWDTLTTTWSEVDHGRLIDDLLTLTRGAALRRLAVAVTGGRALLAGPLTSLLGERLVMRMADPADLAVAGVPREQRGTHLPPGRGVLLGAEEQRATLLHLAVPSPDVGVGPTRSRPRRAANDGWVTPTPVPALPTDLRRADLAPMVGDGGTGARTTAAGIIPWGMGGDMGEVSVGVVGVDRERTRALLVTGEPGSGRSTAVASLVAAICDDGGSVVVVSDRRRGSHGPAITTPGRDRAAGVVHLDAQDPHSGRLLTARPDVVLVVDPVDLVTDTPVEADLIAHLRRPSAAGAAALRIVVVADLQETATAFRGLLHEVRAQRCGILLGAIGPGDGEVLGLRLPPSPRGPLGRGLLVQRGHATTIQIARPSSTESPRQGLS